VPAIRARAYTIICIGGFLKIVIAIRDMNSSMRRAGAHQRRFCRSVESSGGGHGIDGNAGRKFWRNEIAFSGKFLRSRNALHRPNMLRTFPVKKASWYKRKPGFSVAGVAFVLAVMVGEWAALHSTVQALQAESQTDKEANFKRQALGGLFNQWAFDTQKPDEPPSGFSPVDFGEGPAAIWHVAADAEAPTKPNVVRGSSSCQESTCYRLLVADKFEYEYPDITVRLQLPGQGAVGIGGVVLGVKDAKNFYAVSVDLVGQTLEIFRVIDGKESVLGRAPIKPKAVAWHTLRVQRNTIISKDFMETFFDGQLVASVEDQALGLGRIGLLIRGKTTLSFDSLHAVPLYSHRPLSPPAAY
jgi:hypothetical protein